MRNNTSINKSSVFTNRNSMITNRSDVFINRNNNIMNRLSDNLKEVISSIYLRGVTSYLLPSKLRQIQPSQHKEILLILSIENVLSV